MVSLQRFLRTFITVLFLLLFGYGMYFSVSQGTSAYLVRLLSERSFPFQMVLLEGMPGLAQPQTAYQEEMRKRALGMGLYLLTGVNISDPRTYFLDFYAPPKGDIPWLGWAYHPQNPEWEGPILTPLENPIREEPAPITSTQDVQVGVYHSHNAESYAGDGGTDRETSGQNGEVVEVGNRLTESLQIQGVPTLHADRIHDQVYIEAYNRSYETGKALLQGNPTIRLLIDLHRDGIPPEVGKTTVTINRQEAARIMLVIGQKNPDWEENYRVASEILEIAEARYPGLFLKEIRYASEARYNQHLAEGALLIEIGSQLNSKEEALAAVGPLAEVLKVYLEK